MTIQINFSFTNVLDKSEKIQLWIKLFLNQAKCLQRNLLNLITETVIFKDPLQLVIIVGIYLGVSLN